MRTYKDTDNKISVIRILSYL